MDIVNIAAYQFVGIPEPESWIPYLQSRCDELFLKGTIVLATEGINLSMAGSTQSVDSFLQFLKTDAFFENRFVDLIVKQSISDHQPFRFMRVRVAKEIITMRHPMINPEAKRAPIVDPATLRSWLDRGYDDEGREVVLLDTRNAYEVEIGTFDRAVDLKIERFSEFPDAFSATVGDSDDVQNKTIVSFCTGGIRCEKAALFLTDKLGLQNVYQLDGGILRYFEEQGGTHWRGECFVFDERIAVDPQLQESTKDYGVWYRTRVPQKKNKD